MAAMPARQIRTRGRSRFETVILLASPGEFAGPALDPLTGHDAAFLATQRQ